MMQCALERTAFGKVLVKSSLCLPSQRFTVAARPETPIAWSYLFGEECGALAIEQALLISRQ
jgi:hypothetical protein